MHEGVDYEELSRLTEGYSGDDITNVVRDAAMNGLRRRIAGKTPDEIKAMAQAQATMTDPVTAEDFHQAVQKISPSVGKEDVVRHEKWLAEYGSL